MKKSVLAVMLVAAQCAMACAESDVEEKIRRHEAGHAVAMQSGLGVVTGVTVADRNGFTSGDAWITETEVQFLWRDCVMLHAGVQATDPRAPQNQYLFLGGASDLEPILTGIDRLLELQDDGMPIAPVWAHHGSPTHWSHDEIFAACVDKTVEILQSHESDVQNLADALREQGSLDGDEVADIIGPPASEY